MLNNKTILAIVPARGGSQGLYKKNIKLLAGIPLIGWSIENAKKSIYIDRIIVSTDSQEIAIISQKYGADIPFLRPNELSTESATTIDVVKHAITWLIEKEKKKYDIVIILQPTSPLRDNQHIDKSLEKLILHNDARGLISVSIVSKSPFWVKFINEIGYLENYFDSELNFEQRQKQPLLFSPNGAIYIYYSTDLLRINTLKIENTIPFIMEKEVSIDIDDEYDFIIAEILIKNKYE